MDIQAEKMELPAHVVQGIKESIEQADRGEFFTLHEVKKEISALFKKDFSTTPVQKQLK